MVGLHDLKGLFQLKGFNDSNNIFLYFILHVSSLAFFSAGWYKA